MDPTRQSPPSATNAERAESNSAGDLKLASHSISADDRLAAFVAGFETGIALRCDMDTAQAEHEALHAAARPIVAAMVADMQRIQEIDLHARADQRRARQVASCERQRANARPWPDEVAS